MILLMLECLRFKGQKKLMRTSKHSPPRRGGEAAPKAPTGWREAQARQGEASIEGRRQRFGRTDHPGASALLEASPCRACASRRLSRHPSSARRGMLFLILALVFPAQGCHENRGPQQSPD